MSFTTWKWGASFYCPWLSIGFERSLERTKFAYEGPSIHSWGNWTFVFYVKGMR